MGLPGTNRLPDCLVVGQENWDQVERRNQLLIRALAERNPRSRFLFVEQAKRLRTIRSWRLPRPRKVGPNIWAVTPVRPFPDSVSRQLSDQAEARQIRHAARVVGLQDVLLWTQDPRTARLIDRLPVAGLLYDLTDDWAAFEADESRRAAVRAQIESLGRRADLVLACSRWLEADARAWATNVLYLPNAVDPPAATPPVPVDLEELPRPRLGYVGTLHSSRLDVELLARSAELRPDWSFVFLGPDLLREGDRERLFAAPNAHYLGVRSHADIRSYLTGLDVGLVPNLLNDFTRSLDPLKTYEYLAAGLPVISTPAGIPEQFASFVREVTTAEELVQCSAAVIDDDNGARAERRDAVVAETWDARAARIEEALGIRRPKQASSEVSVVIVSFNTRELLKQCLNDLRTQDGVEVQVIVVDNASSDGSREMVRENFPEVDRIELPKNVGFARANNLAFRRCRGRYVLLLNSDAFLHPGALVQLVAAAQRHAGAGAVGPRLLNIDGSLQRSAWPFPSPGRLLVEAIGLHRFLRKTPVYEDLGTWSHDSERDVDFLIGACLLLRADALLEVGGFDETFWLYGEEADLQQRLTTRGWSVVFTPRAQATHVGGASAMESSQRLRHFYTGQMNFLRKHRGRSAWPLARVSLLIGSVLRRRWRAAWTAVVLKAEERG
jgi:GT2 family glycosyltransferase/glycosyltransferase involved in cell wall biosynthesis